MTSWGKITFFSVLNINFLCSYEKCNILLTSQPKKQNKTKTKTKNKKQKKTTKKKKTEEEKKKKKQQQLCN